MLGLLLCSYGDGVFSSQKIAACCENDVAFRVSVGETIPDFPAISKFRRLHLKEFQQAGLVKVGRLARDGTQFVRTLLDTRRRVTTTWNRKRNGWKRRLRNG